MRLRDSLGSKKDQLVLPVSLQATSTKLSISRVNQSNKVFKTLYLRDQLEFDQFN